MAEKKNKVLEMKGITKYFPGVKALDNVDLDLYEGEVLALIGENGAGKSTLMNVLGGVLQPESGKIFVDGEEVIMDSVRKASDLGIAFIHQELNLCDSLDIAQNIFLGHEPRATRGLIKKDELYGKTEEILEQVNLNISPDIKIRDLSIGLQQMVEIAKALSLDARILIMDEPTSSLDKNETKQLFEVIRDLKQKGLSVIFISHRLGEVKEISDRVTVLRDGQNTGQLKSEEICKDRCISLMVGRDIEEYYSFEHEIQEESTFEIRNFVSPEHPDHEIDITVRKGEIVVLAGLVGAGRTELLQTIFGARSARGGGVYLEGEKLEINSPRQAIEQGLALVPENRKEHGLILKKNIEYNVTLPGLAGRNLYQNMKMIRFDEAAEITEEMVEKLNIRLHDIEQQVISLSGGNQQKVVLSKWLSLDPDVLLLDEPTRGIDVVAKDEIYSIIDQMAQQGKYILVVSSEMTEVLSIADRILVMHEGKIGGELQKEQFSEENVVKLATGGI
ncbi:MAG: sugar ABC transporter ATP-binding protein [Halanaerobiaceae bacterium]